MQANNTQAKWNDDRLREYQRQQERLKAMAATSEKSQTVSADKMIENLLKDSFKKTPEVSAAVDQSNHIYGELPLWLQQNSASVPAQYRYLWSLVQSTTDLADTQKVSQVLLTSGLQVDVLGFIWNLANKAIPGQLTKQEFYIVLALVSLVQTGYTFNNLSILKILTVPSIPVLQLGLVKPPISQFETTEKLESPAFYTNIEAPSFSSVQAKTDAALNDSEKLVDHFYSTGNDNSLLNDLKKNVVIQQNSSETHWASTGNYSNTVKPDLLELPSDFSKNSNFPCIGSSPTAELEDDFSAFQSVSASVQSDTDSVCNDVKQAQDSCDDFSDFQSATTEQVDPFETVVVNQKREIPRIPLPKTFTGKLIGSKSNILKLSPDSGKKLKALSTTESLSSLPESKISSSNKVSTVMSVLGSNHGIGSRLANHSFSGRLDKPKCHKHHKIKINMNSNSNPDSEVILGVKTKNLQTVIPKCRPKNSSSFTSFLLKESKIGSETTAEFSNSEPLGNDLDTLGNLGGGEQTRQIEIPMLGTFNETVLPTQSKPQVNNIDLITVQEDKYSALRGIEFELNEGSNVDVKEVNDDFGDFLSADISTIAATESPQPLLEVPNSDSQLLSLDKDKNVQRDWNFSPESYVNPTNVQNVETSLINDSPGLGNEHTFKATDDLFGSFDLLTLSDDVKKDLKDLEPNTASSYQEDNLSAVLKQDGTEGIILGETGEKFSDFQCQPKANEISISGNQSENEFWDFLSAETKPPAEPVDNSTRHDSLPNLDLNISPNDEKEIIWKKCINSCHSLIQEGFDIFNNIVTKSVLDEVFAAPETETYLNNLNIVCQISKRVSQNFNVFSMDQSELERLWGRLQDLCFAYNIKLKSDKDNFPEGKFQCSICLGRIGGDVIFQDINSYHPSCANLWINYVEEILPSVV